MHRQPTNVSLGEPKGNPSQSGNIGKYMGGNNTPFDHLTAHNKTILLCFVGSHRIAQKDYVHYQPKWQKRKEKVVMRWFLIILESKV